MIMMDENNGDKRNLETVLRAYEVEKPSSDFNDRILQKAAAFPREAGPSFMDVALDIILAPTRFFLFKREYMPVTFALAMIVLMVFVNAYYPAQPVIESDIQNYAAVMDPQDNLQMAARPNIEASFQDEFSQEMRILMLEDLESSFEI